MARSQFPLSVYQVLSILSTEPMSAPRIRARLALHHNVPESRINYQAVCLALSMLRDKGLVRKKHYPRASRRPYNQPTVAKYRLL